MVLLSSFRFFIKNLGPPFIIQTPGGKENKNVKEENNTLTVTYAAGISPMKVAKRKIW